MSVLSFPRIYFKGYMSWDPCTFNNNDFQAFQTYDPANAALNWSFLATQGITPDNFTTTFRPWAITLQDDNNPGDNPPNGAFGARIPAEWNMFGSHAVSFVQYNDFTTTITGGDLGYGQPVTSDPIIGGPVSINGDGGRGPGRLVDTNPASPWSSQIYFGALSVGSGAAGFTGWRDPAGYRMHSRWLNPSRIYSTAQFLTSPASSIGVCFQTCFPYDQVKWPAPGSSPLLAALQQAAQAPGALGIMVRFTAYVNLYFMNGILNDTTAQPRTYQELANALQTAWAAWNANPNGEPSPFFSNPCYSHVVGVVGVWNEGELASVPGGRCLAAGAPVAPQISPSAKSRPVSRPARVAGHELRTTPIVTTGDPVRLGPVAANVDFAASLISLDFSGTTPEVGSPGEFPPNLTKADFGTLTVGVVTNDNFTAIATIDYPEYQQSAYEQKAGIIDIPFPNSGTAELLQSGLLAIQVQGQIALVEQSYTAETETRGIYLDQGAQTEFAVMVCQMGEPSANTKVLIAQYDSGLNLVPNNNPPFVAFTTGVLTTVTVSPTNTTNVTIVTTDANGDATIGVSAQNPGFPVLAFFPFTDTLPQPPVSFDFTDAAFYTTVRVLPFDDAVPQAFVDMWNGTQDQAQAWNFIYFQVLYVYDMIFNVMLNYVNLGDQNAVVSSIPYIWPLISQESAQESTYAMPITRDMSAGKRLALQLWIYLVANGYNVPNFNVNSIPPGWTPPQASTRHSHSKRC